MRRISAQERFYWCPRKILFLTQRQTSTVRKNFYSPLTRESSVLKRTVVAQDTDRKLWAIMFPLRTRVGMSLSPGNQIIEEEMQWWLGWLHVICALSVRWLLFWDRLLKSKQKSSSKESPRKTKDSRKSLSWIPSILLVHPNRQSNISPPRSLSSRHLQCDQRSQLVAYDEASYRHWEVKPLG